MAKRYFAAMIAGALLATASVAAVCWIVDPLGIYGSPRIEGFNALKPELKTRSRIFKTINAARGGWQALIVGTSRAETGIDPGDPFFRGARCFNAGLSGQPYEESLALVDAAMRGGQLRTVLAVLDFPVANAHYEGPPDYTPENYRPWRRVSLALTLESFREALRTPFGQDASALVHDYAHWMPDGRFTYPLPAHGARAAAIASEMEYLGHAYFRGPAARFALATSRAHPLEDLRRLVALAHAHGIRLVLVIAPAHARHSESIAAAGLWAEWENWKRALVTINEEEAIKARATAFALWDFSGYNEVTMEPFPALDDSAPMRWYYESSHFTPAAGHRMLARISGNDDNAFGVLLTSANIEQELAAARLARASWREAHPSDAAEIDALAGDISSFRNLQGLR